MKSQLLSKMLFKPLCIMIMLFTVSCSKSDEETNSTASINPPEWIQGTWLSGNNGFRFTNDDFVSIVLNTETSHRGLLNLSIESGQDAATDEVITNESYKLTMTFMEGQSTVYEFSRKSETTIVWENHALKPEYSK